MVFKEVENTGCGHILILFSTAVVTTVTDEKWEKR